MTTAGQDIDLEAIVLAGTGCVKMLTGQLHDPKEATAGSAARNALDALGSFERNIRLLQVRVTSQKASAATRAAVEAERIANAKSKAIETERQRNIRSLELDAQRQKRLAQAQQAAKHAAAGK